MEIRLRGFGLLRRSRRTLIQRDAAIRGNRRRDLRRDLEERRAILALPQKRQHVPSEAAHLPVRQNRLEPVPDFGPVLMIVHRQQNHHAAVLALRPYAPFLEEPIGKILSGVAFERVDGYDGQLGIGFLVQLLAKRRDLLLRTRIDYLREIVDVSLRRELLDLFRGCDIGRDATGKKQHRQNRQRQRSENNLPRLTKLRWSDTVNASHLEKER